MVERASGERYQGEFRNGLKHGKGKMIKMIKNGKVEYDGEWIEGCKHGFGKEIVYCRKGTKKIEGMDFRYAYGELNETGDTKVNKDTYVKIKMYIGNWKNDKKNGIGKEVEIGGSINHGYFRDNKLFKEYRKLEPNLIETLVKNKRSCDSDSNTIFNFKPIDVSTPSLTSHHNSFISPSPYQSRQPKRSFRSFTPISILTNY